MSKRQELVKNTIIIAFGKISTQFITFLLLPLYTSYLATNEFGTVDLAITYISLLAPIITIQLEMAAFRFLIDLRGDGKGISKVISSITWITGLALLVFMSFYLLLNAIIGFPYSIFILTCIVATIFSNLFLQIARGLGKNMHFAVGGIIAGLTSILLNVVLLAGFNLGAPGMLIAIAAANTVSSIYLFISLKLYRYIHHQAVDKKLTKQLLGYSSPLVPNGISWWLINASDRTIISLVLGLSANGIFAIAYKFPLIFSSLFSFFSMSWTESASVNINSKDRDRFFSQTSNASIRLFGSLGVIIIAWIPLVFTSLVNPEYKEAYLYIPLLILSAFFNSIVGLYSAIYVAKKMTKQVASTSIFAALINILLTLSLINFIGLYAAALAGAVAYLVMAIYRHYDVKKYVTITYDKSIFIKLAAAYMLTIMLYYYNNNFGNIVNIVLTTSLAILLNISVIKIIKNKVIDLIFRLRKSSLSPEQTIQEETIQK